MNTALPAALAATLLLLSPGVEAKTFPTPPVTDPFPQPPGVPAELLEEVMSGKHDFLRAELPLAFEITATAKTPAHTYDFPSGNALITEAVDVTVTQYCRYTAIYSSCVLEIPGPRETVKNSGKSWTLNFRLLLNHWDGRAKQRHGVAQYDGPSTPRIKFAGGSRGKPNAALTEQFNWGAIRSDAIEWLPNIFDLDAPNRFVVRWDDLARGITLTLVRKDADGDVFEGTIHLQARPAPWRERGS